MNSLSKCTHSTDCEILYKLTYANKIHGFQGCPVNVHWTQMRTHKTGGAFIIQNACLQREGNDRNKNRHAHHGSWERYQRILKASTKTLISLDIMCVSVFYCSLILLKFNKENVFSKLRKSTLKMRQSTQEPRAAWLTRWNIKKFFSTVLNVWEY